MTRGEFMKMGLSSAAVALTGTVKAVAASLSARTQEEMDSIQKEIDALPNNVFKDFVHGSYAAEDKSKMAMDGRHKTVFQNFECNYGAAHFGEIGLHD